MTGESKRKRKRDQHKPQIAIDRDAMFDLIMRAEKGNALTDDDRQLLDRLGISQKTDDNENAHGKLEDNAYRLVKRLLLDDKITDERHAEAVEELHGILQPGGDDEKRPAYPCPGGFVKKYTDYMSTMGGCHPTHARGMALTLLSTACQHHLLLRAGLGKIIPSVYVLIMGRSSTRKTTQLNAAVDLLKEAGLEDQLLPNDVTGESLRDKLSEQAMGDSSDDDEPRYDAPSGGAMMVDEGTLQLFSGRVEHFRTLRTILLRAADGTGIHYKRIRDGEKRADFVRLTLATTTTPILFFEQCDALAWGDGLIARHSPAFVDDNDPSDMWEPPRIPDHNEHTRKLWSELVDTIRTIKTKLPETPREWTFHPSYFEWNYQRTLKFDQDLKNHKIEAFEGFCTGRLMGRAATFAMLLAVADAAMGLSEWGVVSKKHVDQGIELAEYYLVQQVYIHNIWQGRQVGRGRMQQLLELINNLVQKGRTNYITKRELNRSSRRQFSAMEVDTTLLELFKINAIHLEDRGRKSTRIIPKIGDLGIK